ncbi:TPA: hypothetical protein QH592_005543 [Raoultella ornithinolytica]|nr:hypothetical protein [Raoultella ornithinolytica]HEC2581869.1 hypothetical protein [Raoultella ornithinolytica]HEC2588993.1 hypothetical protein [Raoultella ornithinolytica]HEC2624334.1 hypothetical protein [Raoultella ornithinolytica]
MIFTISKTVRKCIYYPDFGIQEAPEETTVDITYEVTGIKSLCAPLGVATYSMSAAGCVVEGVKDFEFEWSGIGNPLEAAEAALEQALQ